METTANGAISAETSKEEDQLETLTSFIVKALKIKDEDLET